MNIPHSLVADNESNLVPGLSLRPGRAPLGHKGISTAKTVASNKQIMRADYIEPLRQ